MKKSKLNIFIFTVLNSFSRRVENKKVLILCRNPDQLGGVTNYCNSIFQHFDSQSFSIERFIIGRRPGCNSDIKFLMMNIYDYIRLFFKLFDKNIALVHLNPSLGVVNLIRDAVFLFIAKLHSKQIFVFWHGWNQNMEKKIVNHTILKRLFRVVFDSANASAVLASSFVNTLRDFGFKQHIYIETTTINNDLLGNYTPDKKIKEIEEGAKLRILYLSRLEISKGVIELINAFKKVQINGKKFELLIAGGGTDSDLVKQHVAAANDDRIKFLGYVTGKKKRKVFEDSHLFCLPTRYGEGLPVSILEAMAFGMPVLTTPVGGIPDIIVDKKHGYYIDSYDVENFAKQLSQIISNTKALASIAMTNTLYSRQRFMASVVVKRLDNIYNEIIGGE